MDLLSLPTPQTELLSSLKRSIVVVRSEDPHLIAAGNRDTEGGEVSEGGLKF